VVALVVYVQTLFVFHPSSHRERTLLYGSNSGIDSVRTFYISKIARWWLIKYSSDLKSINSCAKMLVERVR